MSKKKRILFLTFYYKPDLCAGSFRAASLIEAFKAKENDDVELTVVSTSPNRYKTFKIEAPAYEEFDNYTLHRIAIPQHKSGFLDQARSFSKFFFKALEKSKNQEYDLVVATSSRLFTAFLGAVISKRLKLPLYLDIRDIFTDTMNDVLKNPILRLCCVPIFRMIEKFTFNSATRINLVSEGFRNYFEERYNKPYTFYPNGIDPEFIDVDFSKQESTSKKIITYAGNFGDGQGLHEIIPKSASLLKDENYEFWIIGDGGKKEKLVSSIKELKLTNVKIIDPVNRKELLDYYKKSDFLFLHLNDYDAFKKVLPSKIFEYGATGKPMIAGVAGYAAKFIKENLPETILFSPCNAEEFVDKLRKFSLSTSSNPDFMYQYSRPTIMSKMITDLFEMVAIKPVKKEVV